MHPAERDLAHSGDLFQIVLHYFLSLAPKIIALQKDSGKNNVLEPLILLETFFPPSVLGQARSLEKADI